MRPKLLTAIHNCLVSYPADADDSKIKAVYTLLEKDIEEKEFFVLSDEQLKILERARELHLAGEANRIAAAKRGRS